ncbi:hypothetical protein BJ508DRAFT_320285 [Ascobolus immersus RN42]|uniref:Uncharacterized protein n=1 Tax=Ascobolus immersus RN42 TaxID=1160509 RepID=A0A3N4J2S9_ASCIM|nr:hypothetical protein BJ508DRAFT_320285 [Ascobolus immersus RN42]
MVRDYLAALTPSPPKEFASPLEELDYLQTIFANGPAYAAYYDLPRFFSYCFPLDDSATPSCIPDNRAIDLSRVARKIAERALIICKERKLCFRILNYNEEESIYFCADQIFVLGTDEHAVEDLYKQILHKHEQSKNENFATRLREIGRSMVGTKGQGMIYDENGKVIGALF